MCSRQCAIQIHVYLYLTLPYHSEWYVIVVLSLQKEEKFLNMIMEFIPETLWSVAQCDGTNKPLLESLYVKVLSKSFH